MIIAFVVLAVLFAVFVLENRVPVTVGFLSWRYDTNVGLAGVVPLILGLVVGFGMSLGKQQLLRTQLRNPGARTKAAEAKLREIDRQRESASDQQEPGKEREQSN